MATGASCLCCYDDTISTVQLVECNANVGHTVCTTCIHNYVREALDRNIDFDFHCFVGIDCACEFSDMAMTISLPKDVKERVDRAAYRKRVTALADIWTCKMCDDVFSVDKFCDTQFCRGCNETEYCTFCLAYSHPNITCDEVRQHTNSTKTPRNMAAEAMAGVVIRCCPMCRTRFVKDDGCNKITCSTPGCSTMSCYLCKQQVDDYDHFCHCQNGKPPLEPCPDCKKKCSLHTSEDDIASIEKQWLMEAGQSALAARGINDSYQVQDILADLL